MGLGSIQFGGLASGLDTNAIISTLVSLERRPINALQGERDVNREKISLLGQLEGLVKSLQDKAQELLGSNGNSFFSNQVSSTDESIATVTTSGDVLPGNYNINVVELADRDRFAFEGLADANAEISDFVGFQLDYDGTTYAFGDSNLSLNEIAAGINDAMGEAVTAEVINTGTEGNPSWQLTITGNDTGEDFSFQNLVTDLPDELVPVNSTVGIPGQLSVARNATIEVNGLTVERSTNEFAGVIQGMTFNVREPGTVSLNAEVDAEGTEANVQGFIDAYNEVVDFINSQSTFSEEAGPGGELFGDTVLSTIRTSLNSALFSVDLDTIQNDTTGYSTLSLVGVDLQSDGRLELDSTQFREKYEENSQALADLFSGDGGALSRLDEAIDALVKGPVDDEGNYFTIGGPDGERITGVFDQRKDVLEGINSRIGDDIDRLERNVASFEESLILKYANLEQLMAGLQSQQGFLSSL